ncbi:hypothetical protein EDB83DRAFT_2377525 [Lactarius deliciosus]|nr:hypothetical protein EDB83DRAFT_2377525 [Lactarius deliciosus]
MDDEQWLRLVRTFDGTKDLHVHGELAKDILHALCPGEEEHKIVFPSLRNLYVQERISMQGPLRGSLESFVTQRQLSGRPVEIYYGGLPSLQRTIPIRTSKLPPLSEDRFKVLFTQFANTTGLRLNDRDFVIDGRPVGPWALHRAVFARNGFELVTANDEWPAVGAALGFPPVFPPTQPLRCAPVIAYRLQQLYNDCLRHFEQAYLNNVIARLRSSQPLVFAQASQQAQAHQPTDADYQTHLPTFR